MILLTFGLIVGIMVGVVLAMIIYSLAGTGRVIEIRYKQKDTYCDVWSPQLPGASAGGSYLNPALVSFLRQHGEKLGVVLVDEPYR